MAKLWGTLLALAILIGAGDYAYAAEPEKDFATWLAAFRTEASSKGISQVTLDQSLAGLQPIDRIIELDRRQPEFTMSFDGYMAHVVSPRRIADGRAAYARHRELVRAVAKRIGVPGPVIMAMWGIESDFGHVSGHFSVVPSLATLAYDGRRSQYFRGELLNALKMIDSGVPLSRMEGSWAGAMGQCQFMPSTYLAYARAWSGQGPADIWSNPADVFASTANYLAGIGWQTEQHWGRAVKLPRHGIAPALIGLDKPRSLTAWRKLGLRQLNGKSLPGPGSLRASLIRAETGKEGNADKGPPYLVYDNFRTLMKWNRSVFFAVAAGTLADRIGNR
jgi:membrane-bound lytic murein transglycosylase B